MKFPQSPDPSSDMVPVTVEIAPGQLATVRLPRESVGRYGLVKNVLRQNGTIIPVWKSWHTQVRLTRDLPRKLGLDVNIDTIRALVYANLVKGGKISPSLTLVDLDSLIHHLEATQKDSRGYWTPERQDAYREGWKACHGHTEGMTTRLRKNHKSKRRQAPSLTNTDRQKNVRKPSDNPSQLPLFPDEPAPKGGQS